MLICASLNNENGTEATALSLLSHYFSCYISEYSESEITLGCRALTKASGVPISSCYHARLNSSLLKQVS